MFSDSHVWTALEQHKLTIPTDREQYCDKGHVGTYAGIFYRENAAKGQKSYGGYANYWRGPTRFVVQIPEGMDPAAAAPMLCGGVTVFSPLQQYGAGKTAKDVGVVGIGGLGHFAVLFANAMGANVTAITHSSSKDEDAKKLGASKVIHTGEDTAEAVKGHERSLDLIICSSSGSLFQSHLWRCCQICQCLMRRISLTNTTLDDPNMNLNAFLTLLRPGGHFILVGVPEVNKLPDVHPFTVIMGMSLSVTRTIRLPTDSSP